MRPYATGRTIKAKAAGWPVYELDASHNPHITLPEGLAWLLEGIVREA